MTCKEAEEKLALHVYGELEPAAGAQVESHLQACGKCAARLEELRRLEGLLALRRQPEPGADLLANCRRALDERLDYEQHGWWRLIADWTAMPAWIHPSRVMAALTMVLFGFGLGWSLRPRLNRPLATPATNTAAQIPLNTADLGRISSISQVSPDPRTGGVRITLNSERRVTLDGSLDDPGIRQVLVYAMKRYDNPGIRLDTLDALKRQSHDPSIQRAFLDALEHDPNAGVRLEALQSIRDMTWTPEMRQALLTAVRHDSNPGVRVAAIDELVGHAVKQRDQELVPVLENLAARDSSVYVRMKSLSGLRELGAE